MAAVNQGDGSESDEEYGVVRDEQIIIEQGLVGFLACHSLRCKRE